MKYNDLKKACLYSSKKNYKKILYLWLVILFISIPTDIFLVFVLKNMDLLLSGFIFYIIIAFSIVLLDFLICYKKIIISKDEIIFFNLFGKKIRTFEMNKDIEIVYNTVCFVVKYKKIKEKIFYEKDNELIFSVIKNNTKSKFIKNITLDEIKDINNFYKILGKINIVILILYNLFVLFFTIHHINEFISYFYIYKGEQYLSKERKIQKSDNIRLDIKSNNLLQTYNYYKKACITYLNQEKKVYEYIIGYAFIYDKNDYKEFSKMEKLIYPENSDDKQ